MVRPVLLDTDIAGDVDDALALALLLACDELNLVAVTTVGCDNSARGRAALSIMALAGRRVEVCLGAEAPLLRQRSHHPVDVDLYPSPGDSASREPAAERIVRAATEFEGLELVTIGPLTNVARAVALDPKLASKVSRLTMMGGHLGDIEAGDAMLAPGVEYNLVHDPEATMVVLGAGFNLRMVPLEITMQTWLRPQDIDLLRMSGDSMAMLLAALVDRWTPVQKALFGHAGLALDEDNAAFLHDPLTILSLVDQSALEFEDQVVVATIEDHTLRTRISPAPDIGFVANVATGVNPDKARAQILSRLLDR